MAEPADNPEKSVPFIADVTPAGTPGPEAPQPKDPLREAYGAKKPIEGRITAIIRGGYEVTLEGAVGFCPFGQIDIRRNDDQLSFLHQTFAFLITDYRRKGKRIVLSRRRLLEAEARREKRRALREALQKIEVGSIHEGSVTGLTPFGAFVDLGGVQGMVHVSEISHARVAAPAERLKVGERVRVKVLKAEPKKRRISLSMKVLEPDPWETAARTIRAHSIVAGRLVRVTEFGAFVEVAPGVDGLIHASELPPDGLEAMKTRLETDPQIAVLVLKVESSRQRVSLAPAPDGARPGELLRLKPLKSGAVLEGVVEKADAAGLVVKLGPGRSGFIPAGETGAPRDADLRRLFPAGTGIRGLVTEVEPGGRKVRLSIKKAEKRDQQQQLAEYRKSAASGASGSFATLADLFRKDRTGS